MVRVVSVVNWAARSPMVAVPLVGQYVRLDPWNLETDPPLLWEALGGNDGSINERLQWWGLPELDTCDDLARLVQGIQDQEGGRSCVNVVRLLPSLQVAGMASFIGTNAEHGTTEVGYVAHGSLLARTRAATETHYLLARHALETNGYRRLEWKCDSNNSPSGRAAIRYGYTYEGCFRKHRVTAKGTNRDTNWYSMLDEEWPSRKDAFEAWLNPSNFDQDGVQKTKLEDFRQD